MRTYINAAIDMVLCNGNIPDLMYIYPSFIFNNSRGEVSINPLLLLNE